MVSKEHKKIREDHDMCVKCGSREVCIIFSMLHVTNPQIVELEKDNRIVVAIAGCDFFREETKKV